MQHGDLTQEYRLLYILICCGLILTITPVTALESDGSNQSVSHVPALVLVYMVGSDLESGTGHPEGGETGTADLMNMIDGYGNTSPDALQILVAYGGAAKPGWEGMTIASITDLKTDAANGIIGDENLSEYQDPEADMGSKESMQTFLSYASHQYAGNTTYLIFWDHGNGFLGFGWDENTGNHLSISDITDILKEEQSHFDLIGFDACLMSGLEVAKSLEPYTRYMLASEEISAGGWSYDKWIDALAQDPQQSPEKLGVTIIKTFIKPDEPLGNTAALIDLSKLQPVIEGVDTLGTALDGAMIPEQSIIPIARAYEKTTRFGENSGDGPALGAVDLGTLTGYLNTSVPGTQSASDELSTALTNAVVYVGHDDLISNVTGLSLADPLTVSKETYVNESSVLSISPNWDSFVSNLKTQMKNELPSVDMVSVGTNSYQIANASEPESVSAVYFAVQNNTELLQLGTLPVDPDENGTYTLPYWDGTWYYLQDTHDPAQIALMDLYYGDTTASGISKFISEVDMIRSGTGYDAVMYAYLDPDTTWTKLSLRPYSVKDNETIFSRSGYTPGPGDRLLTFAAAYDTDGNETGISQLGEMNLSGGVQMVRGILPEGEYASALMVESPNGEQDVRDINAISIKDGQVSPLISEANQTSSLVPGV